MIRLLVAATTLGALVGIAAAQTPKKAAKAPKAPPVTATLPVVGEALPVTGSATWSKRTWLYDVPSQKDAGGKVVIHWFCSPKVKTCADDLARIVTLKENGRVYIVANIAGTKGQAKKLDPIRESEGVGRGTVAFGPNVTKMMKQTSITGPASVVVDLDGKVVMVATGSTPADLDARDKKVSELVATIKEYVATPSDSPKGIKPGDKFTLSVSIKLASWLTYSKQAPSEFKLTAPPDFKCDAKELKGDQLKITDQTLTASVTCTAPKGSYEARGDLRFSYETPNNAAGIGNEGAKWKFEIKP
ncbi:MAG: hypothetical protein H0T42_21740 [Deltaproteobacteria bacterium]|nr:hypothetical protein [Deltaproteobacteria bacterium]